MRITDAQSFDNIAGLRVSRFHAIGFTRQATGEATSCLHRAMGESAFGGKDIRGLGYVGHLLTLLSTSSTYLAMPWLS